jgi:hypothetical protein
VTRNEKAAYRPRHVLQKKHLAFEAAQLPVYAHMLGVRAGGSPEIWRRKGNMDYTQKAFKMSSVS